MVQQNIVLADLLEDVPRLSRQVQFARHERLELEIGALCLLINAGNSR